MIARMEDNTRFQVGDWTVTPTQYRLERSGRKRRVKPRTMQVLVHLARRAGEVVSVEELLASVWEGRVVGDGSIYQTINQLRHALGDHTDDVRFIQTIPKQGYRLIAPVTMLSAEPIPGRPGPPELSVRRRLALGAAAGFAAVVIAIAAWTGATREPPAGASSEPIIAVMPFENLSPGPADAYLAIGIHNELLIALSRFKGLHVISRNAVAGYQSGATEIDEITRTLRVDAIVRASVQRAEDLLRVNVMLVDATSHEQLWGEAFEEALRAEGLFAVQSRIAASIAAALQVTLSSEEVADLSVIPTRNTDAWLYYLQGLDYEMRVDREELAAQLFEHAVTRDPNLAPAWARLAGVHLEFYHVEDTTSERLALVDEALQRALSLDPDLPQAHIVRGIYADTVEKDYESALRAFAVVERLAPGDVRLYQARAKAHRRAGSLAEAARDLERCLRLDPRNADTLFMIYRLHLNLREYAEAEAALDRILDLYPDDRLAHRRKTQIPLYRDGNVERVRTAYRNPYLEDPYSLSWWAAYYDRDPDAALRYLDARNLTAPDGSQRYGLTYLLLANDPDAAEKHFRARHDYVVEDHPHFDIGSHPEDISRKSDLAWALAYLGDTDAAVRLAHEALGQLRQSADAWIFPILHLGIVWAFLAAGDFDTAIAELDAYLGAPGPWSIEGLLPDPRLDPLRNLSEFRALVDKYRR